MLYGRKCEGVPRSEGAKEFPVYHFWGHLFQIFWLTKVLIFFVQHYRVLSLEIHKVFSALNNCVLYS
jgi:hypothetical protein